MMISTKGRYALRVMLDLALHREEGYISLKTVAERQDTSMKYLEAIVAQLNRAGLLDSQRGKTGGYRLKGQPSQYSVGQILKLSEGSLAPVACLNCEENECDRLDHCLTLPMWKQLDTLIEDYLESVTLQDLIDRRLPHPCIGCSAAPGTCEDKEKEETTK